MKLTPKIYARTLLQLSSGKKEKEIAALAREFSALFIKRGKTKFLRAIIAELERIMQGEKGPRVTVTVAAEQQRGIADRVKKELSGIGDPHVDVHIDPSIVGGMILSVGDIRMDASVAHQLRALRAHMKS